MFTYLSVGSSENNQPIIGSSVRVYVTGPSSPWIQPLKPLNHIEGDSPSNRILGHFIKLLFLRVIIMLHKICE